MVFYGQCPLEGEGGRWAHLENWMGCMSPMNPCLKDLNGKVASSFVPFVIEGVVVTNGHHPMVDMVDTHS